MDDCDEYLGGDFNPLWDDEDELPAGSCAECDEDLYHDDCWFFGDEDSGEGVWLCGRCFWIAEGCPEPGGTEE
jgi:hypothetical protein